MDIFDPILIADRRERSVKFIVWGICPEFQIEMAFDSDHNASFAAKQWAKTFRGSAFCYCIRNGEIGGRPFDGYYFTVDGGSNSLRKADYVA